MNVLIVNGFNKTERELKKFEEFVCLIKNVKTRLRWDIERNNEKNRNRPYRVFFKR